MIDETYLLIKPALSLLIVCLVQSLGLLAALVGNLLEPLSLYQPINFGYLKSGGFTLLFGSLLSYTLPPYSLNLPLYEWPKLYPNHYQPRQYQLYLT